MSWPTPDPASQQLTPASQPTPVRPPGPARVGRPATALRRARGRGFWWAIAAGALGLALAFCAWFAQPLQPVRLVPLAPGAPYFDVRGTSYTVLRRAELAEFASLGELAHPAPGAVFLEYTVQVDGYRHERDGIYDIMICTFELVGSQGQFWEAEDLYVSGGRQTFCEEEVDATSFQVTSVYEVPRSMLDEVLGLVPEHVAMDPHWGRQPVFSEPA